MSNGRKCTAAVSFNGQKVTGMVGDYLESISYEDVAKDRSDALTIRLANIDKKWLNEWYPKKGDSMRCAFNFTDWNKEGDNFTVDCGKFVLDEISFSGSPSSATFTGLALPANASFNTKLRNKVWNKITIEKIAATIGRRYRMTLQYDAPSVSITTLEQSDEDDCSFLYSLCKEYNLGMKVYDYKLVIYDPGKMEQKAPVATLTPQSFIDGAWEFVDSLDGTYNGARIAYKTSKKGSKTKSMYIGTVKETDENARTLRVSKTANNKADAKFQATAQINASNEEATKLSGTIWPDGNICAGATVSVTGFGVPNGKYFVEQCTINLEPGGVTMNVVMHKCVKRIRRV